MEPIEITIDGFAQAQKAPQGTIMPPLPAAIRGRHFVKMYTPAEVRKWQTNARALAIMQMQRRPPAEGPLTVSIRVFLPPPRSMSQKATRMALTGLNRPITRPDCSNYCKAIEDSLNGIAWLDDAQIVDLHVSKQYDAKPRVEVSVKEWQPNGGLFNVR